MSIQKFTRLGVAGQLPGAVLVALLVGLLAPLPGDQIVRLALASRKGSSRMLVESRGRCGKKQEKNKTNTCVFDFFLLELMGGQSCLPRSTCYGSESVIYIYIHVCVWLFQGALVVFVEGNTKGNHQSVWGKNMDLSKGW